MLSTGICKCKGIAKFCNSLSVSSYLTCDSYSVHSIEMDAGVTQVFERAIVALSRREDPSDTKYVVSFFIAKVFVALIWFPCSEDWDQLHLLEVLQ